MIYLSYVPVAYDLFVSVEPDFRLVGESLFFAWPKKSNQKKGRDQLGPHQAGLRLLCVTRQLGTGNHWSSTAWFSGLVVWSNLGPQNPLLHSLKRPI